METTGQIVIATLSIGYNREAKRNKAEDLGLDYAPETTPDGLPMRGLGSHWPSADAPQLVKERANEAARIRAAFGRAFVAAPFESTFVLPEQGAGKRFLATLDPAPRDDVQVTVSEYTLGVVSQAPQEVSEWADRISKQLADVPLGRGKEASANGLAMLRNLAACPVISEQTRTELTALIADAELERVNRVDFRRKLAELNVEIGGPAVEPRRPVRPAPTPEPEPSDKPAPSFPPRRFGAQMAMM